ncbi:hypothetical protein VARIO8X_110167 [Burkholderiales bacterium 8X]|nr:hypothetical protein VARIO8X_110167 [Burkholderiales bacterium 8X]
MQILHTLMFITVAFIMSWRLSPAASR